MLWPTTCRRDTALCFFPFLCATAALPGHAVLELPCPAALPAQLAGCTHTRPPVKPRPTCLLCREQVPLDMAEYELRAREVAALRQWVAAPADALRRDQSPILTPEYMARIVPR